MMAGVNMVYHGAGWMEGGLSSSFEKLIIDADMPQMMARIMELLEVSEETMTLDAIEDVGIAGHFFGTPHTIERYETAFCRPLISDWRNFEIWIEAGSPSAEQRANALFKRMLERYEPPPMAVERREALDAYVARRKQEIRESSR